MLLPSSRVLRTAAITKKRMAGINYQLYRKHSAIKFLFYLGIDRGNSLE